MPLRKGSLQGFSVPGIGFTTDGEARAIRSKVWSAGCALDPGRDLMLVPSPMRSGPCQRAAREVGNGRSVMVLSIVRFWPVILAVVLLGMAVRLVS